MKKRSLSLALIGSILTSCGPILVEPVSTQRVAYPAASTPSTPAPPQTPTTTIGNSVGQTVTSPAQKVIREQVSTTSNVNVPALPTISSYPVALPIPGKPGYVYNPYNNNPVYVQGIPSGKTVLDPKDPNSEHKFRLP